MLGSPGPPLRRHARRRGQAARRRGRRLPQGPDHDRQRDSVGHRRGDGSGSHPGNRNQHDEQDHGEDGGQPLRFAHEPRPSESAQQVTGDLAAREEHAAGGEQPHQRHRAAVLWAEDEGDQPVDDSGEGKQDGARRARAGQDGGPLKPVTAGGDPLPCGQLGEYDVADGGYQRYRDQGDRNSDRVAAQLRRRNDLGQHELIQVRVDSRGRSRGELRQPVLHEGPDECGPVPSRDQPASQAPVIGVDELDRRRHGQRKDGGVKAEQPEPPQQGDACQAEHRLA
jgi:hypothetical protein